MEDHDKAIFDEISRWIPEEHVARYWRCLTRIKDLPETDSIMRCILAMGIFTVIIRQAPGEVAKQLAEFERVVGSLLTETQRSCQQLMASLQARAASLETLHQRVVSPTHLDKVAQDVCERIERQVAMYLKPLGKNKTDAFTEKAKLVERWLDLLERKSQETMRTFNDLVPALQTKLGQLEQMALLLERSTSESAARQRQIESNRRPWPWIALTTVACVVMIVGSGLTGFWINHLIEHNRRPTSQPVQQTADN